MTPKNLHPWDVSISDAKRIQDRLREQVIVSPLSDNIRYIGGADVSFDKGSNIIYAAIVIFNFPELEIVEKQGLSEKTNFPYVPGLLAFREGPPVLHVWEKLATKPDVIIFDAHGLAHPRRFGLACHLGVVLDIPSIGCAKSVLVGTYAEPGVKAGEFSSLVDKGEEVGTAIRTKDDVSPVFVTIGHRVDLPSSMKLVLSCTRGYRIPEPTRQAHLVVNALRRGELIEKISPKREDQLDLF